MPKELPISATLSEATRLFNELGVYAPGTTPRAGGDNRDPLFHEYMIAKHLESVAKKRAENMLEKMMLQAGDVNTRDPGMHTIEQTGRYTYLVEIKRGAERFDVKAFTSALARLKLPPDTRAKIDAEIKAATKQNNPSRSYRVIANG